VKIFDGFLYHNKPEMLKLHLETLAREVEAFVMVQSTHTFTGIPRAIVTLEQLGLERFRSKVIEVTFSLNTAVPTPHREEFQRNMIAAPLAAGGISDEDIVIISDLDEIVDPLVVRRLAKEPSLLRCFGKVRFQMQFHYYFLDCLLDSSQQPWSQCVAVLWGRLRRSSCHQERCSNLILEDKMMKIRQDSNDLAIEIQNAGWHFSWFGSPQQVQETISSHVDPNSRHFEWLTPDDVMKIRLDGKDIFGRDLPPLRFLDELPALPPTVMDNLEYYRQLGWFRGSEHAVPVVES
jgi:beta-1,4-mannosyl-glycoprotein beta-1,4-N-acetylglucosaminyltransferase